MLFYRRGSLSFYLKVDAARGQEHGERRANEGAGAVEHEDEVEGGEQRADEVFDIFVGIDPGMKNTLSMTAIMRNSAETWSYSCPSRELHARMESERRRKETLRQREAVVALGEDAVENALAKKKSSYGSLNRRAHASVTLVPNAYASKAKEFVENLLAWWRRNAPDRAEASPRVFLAVGHCGITPESRLVWYQSPMRGYPRTSSGRALAEIVRALALQQMKPTVEIVHERNSSKYCPFCDSELSEAVKETISFPDVGRRLTTENTRNGRVCTNGACPRMRGCVNRDASAAVNMLRKAVNATADVTEGSAGDDSYRLREEERGVLNAGLVEALRRINVQNAAFPRDVREAAPEEQQGVARRDVREAAPEEQQGVARRDVREAAPEEQQGVARRAREEARSGRERAETRRPRIGANGDGRVIRQPDFDSA